LNQDELKAQVLRRLFVGRKVSDEFKSLIVSEMDAILKPYTDRDQKAAERGQAPYRFPPDAVFWLERVTRQRARI
jgi:hypothetical protein